MKANTCRRILWSVALVFSVGLAVAAQTTSFNYQGTLQDNSQPANGSYDFEFALFDALEGGSQVGSTVTRTNVQVTDGSFSVTLDFGGEFPGAGRWFEISVRQIGGGAFTTLAPRQPVNSAPYSVKSLSADFAADAQTAVSAATADNALQLGGVSAGQFVVTTDPRMSDARTPAPGSGDYVQNTTTQQYAHDLENANKQDSIHQYRIIKRQAENNSEHRKLRGYKKSAGFPKPGMGQAC